MFFSLSALLHVLAASASIPFVAAQTPAPVTTDDLDSKISPNAAPPGFNVDGGSVFTNFVNAYNNKQYFTRLTRGPDVREKPGSDPTPAFRFHWCSDLTFSVSGISNSSLTGYAGRCVERLMPGNADLIASGSQTPYVTLDGWGATVGVSTVFVEQQNVFSGQMHTNTDDGTWRMWDDGRKTMPMIAWEPNDEGDMHPNAALSSFSSFGEFTWMSIDEVTQLFNTTADEYTPEKFKQVYREIWIKDHEKEAAMDNPYAEAELEIIEAVKNETDGRKLVSVVAERFVSATLGVFGI